MVEQFSGETLSELSATERDVLHSVLYELNGLIKYCDDWVNHYHASQPVDSDTLLSTLATALTQCRDNIRLSVKEYKKANKQPHAESLDNDILNSDFNPYPYGFNSFQNTLI